MRYPSVPDALKSKPNWVLWKLEIDAKGKPTKEPYQLNGEHAASNKPTTWKPFDEVKHCEKIGFVFNGDGVMGIDLDSAILPDGTIEPTFKGIVDTLSTTYTEVSPSGKGLHIFFRCNEHPYETGRKKKFDDGKGVEIYFLAHYFTVTGITWKNSPNEIREYPVETIRGLLTPLLDGKKNPPVSNDNFVITPPFFTVSPTMTDEQVHYKASHAFNGDKFNRLMNGNITGYPSDSEADAALAWLLAFYTQDTTQIERIMRAGGLNRGKWDSNKGYLPNTIGKAITSCSARFADAYRPLNYKGGKEEPPLPTITEEEIQAYRDENIKSFSELPELPEGFFRDYMDFGIRMSYAYSAYHFGCSLALVSLVLGRKVMMRSTGATIYPNVFVACIGATSISGKSTTCDLFFDQFFLALVRQDGVIEELTKKTSPAGLLQRLADVPTRLWYYDECSEFFSDIQNHWAEALESILCSVYDGRRVSYGLAKGKGKPDTFVADRVFLTCLWNTTDSEMERKAQWSNVSNGFLPRFMWFWMHGKNTPKLNREIDADDIMLREELYKKIKRLQVVIKKANETAVGIGMETLIVFKPHKKIEIWKLHDDLKHLSKEDEMHRIATARLMPQSYKIAILFSMMDESILADIEKRMVLPIELDIPDGYAELAIQICDGYLRPRLEYLMDLSKNNDTKNYQIQVIKVLKANNGIEKRHLVQQRTHMNRRNFEETIQSLEDSAVVEVLTTGKTGGRNGQILKLLKT